MSKLSVYGTYYESKYPNRFKNLKLIFQTSNYFSFIKLLEQKHLSLFNELKKLTTVNSNKMRVTQPEMFKFLFPEVKWECKTCKCLVEFNAGTKKPRKFCSTFCCATNKEITQSRKESKEYNRSLLPTRTSMIEIHKINNFSKKYEKHFPKRTQFLQKVFKKLDFISFRKLLQNKYPLLYLKLCNFHTSGMNTPTLRKKEVFCFLFPNYKWKCEFCGKQHDTIVLNVPRRHCSIECANKNPIKQLKCKTTCLTKYGYEHPTQNSQVRKKTIKTNIKRYGVSNPTQDPEIFARAQQSMYRKNQ